MKKNIFSFLIILFIFGFNVTAQDIELDDISTTIGNDSISAEPYDLPDFKNRVTEVDGSGNIVPELPQIEQPEDTELASSLAEENQKTLYAQVQAGGGFPTLFNCDFSLYTLNGIEPFKLDFSHTTANGYVGNSLNGNYFDRTTQLLASKKFKAGIFSAQLEGLYVSAGDGFQNKTPLFTSMNKDYIKIDTDFCFDFNDNFDMKLNLDSSFYNRYSQTSDLKNLDEIPPLASCIYQAGYLTATPELILDFYYKYFSAYLSGSYSINGNLYGLSSDFSYIKTTKDEHSAIQKEIVAGNDETRFSHRGIFSVGMKLATDYARIYGNASAVIGNYLNGQNVVVPFNVGVEYSIPVYFSNRRFTIGAEGGMESFANLAWDYENKYKFTVLSFIPEETSFWYGNCNICVPLKSSFTGKAFVEYKRNALGNNSWEPDYSDGYGANGVYGYANKELQLLTTEFELSYHYKILTLAGKWHSCWLDVPVLENVQLLGLQVNLQDENARWGIDLQGMYSFENSLTVPLINFEGFIGINRAVRVVVNATDIVKLVKAEKRVYAGEYIGRGGTASLLLKFFL